MLEVKIVGLTISLYFTTCNFSLQKLLYGTKVLFMMVVKITVLTILLYFTTCNVKNCKEKNNLAECKQVH